MTPKMRPYGGEEDYWRLRALLREAFWRNGRRERCWQVARLDYWRWHGLRNVDPQPIEGLIYLWEAAGQLVAALNPEGRGEAFFQVHPDHRTPALEEEMLALAEERLAAPTPEGKRRLEVWARRDDALRRELLARHGYAPGAWPEYGRQRSLDLPIPAAPPPEGYTVRSLGGPEELPARSWASWRGFHPNEPDDKYDGWTWYRHIQSAPLYRRDLDMVAVTTTGEIAAFCTLWYDDVTRTGYFEPVATVPEHQRRGLGKAVMCEAMRRAREMGAALVTVAGFSAAANALYGSVMGCEPEIAEAWGKAW